MHSRTRESGFALIGAIVVSLLVVAFAGYLSVTQARAVKQLAHHELRATLDAIRLHIRRARISCSNTTSQNKSVPPGGTWDLYQFGATTPYLKSGSVIGGLTLKFTPEPSGGIRTLVAKLDPGVSHATALKSDAAPDPLTGKAVFWDYLVMPGNPTGDLFGSDPLCTGDWLPSCKWYSQPGQGPSACPQRGQVITSVFQWAPAFATWNAPSVCGPFYPGSYNAGGYAITSPRPGSCGAPDGSFVAYTQWYTCCTIPGYR